MTPNLESSMHPTRSPWLPPGGRWSLWFWAGVTSPGQNNFSALPNRQGATISRRWPGGMRKICLKLVTSRPMQALYLPLWPHHDLLNLSYWVQLSKQVNWHQCYKLSQNEVVKGWKALEDCDNLSVEVLSKIADTAIESAASILRKRGVLNDQGTLW